MAEFFQQQPDCRNPPQGNEISIILVLLVGHIDCFHILGPVVAFKLPIDFIIWFLLLSGCTIHFYIF